MVSYPHVFVLDGETYMLYQGNEMGRTGFGLARLEAIRLSGGDREVAKLGKIFDPTDTVRLPNAWSLPNLRRRWSSTTASGCTFPRATRRDR